MEERTVDFSLNPRRRYQPLARTNDKTLRWGKDQRAEEKNGSHFDAEYLQRLKNRDPEIQEDFYSYFNPRLKMQLRGRSLPAAVIQDVIQETFVQVLTAVKNDRVHTPAAFGGYVSAVCRNVFPQYSRNLAKNVDVTEIDIPDPAVDLEISILLRERQDQIERVLKDLRKKDRDVLYARVYCQLTFEEMSVLFGATPDHLRLVLHRALKKFAKACEERHLDFFRADPKSR
jgi:RNA polymerase sigma factor (sigma-70 family)